MDAPVRAVDDKPDPLTQFVAAETLVEHPADNPLGQLSAMHGVGRDRALLRQPLARQDPMHRLDGVAALTEVPQGRFGLGRNGPLPRLNLARQAEALQFARSLDQQRPVLAQGLQHFLVGSEIGELAAARLLGDQHPVQAREAVGVHLPLQAAGDLLLGLPAQLQGDDLARPFPHPMGDVVAGDVERLAVVGDSSDDDVGVGMAGVVVIDRDPVELGVEVGLHLFHQIAAGLTKVRQLCALLRRNDEAELVAVLASPFEKGLTILRIPLGGIGHTLLAVPRDPVPLQIAQVSVHRLGAGEGASPRRPTLRVEPHHPGLDHHPPRASADTLPVPAPGAPSLQLGRRGCAPAARVKATCPLPLPGQSMRVAARPTDGAMHLAHEARRPRSYAPAARTAVADPAGTDAEMLVVVRHRGDDRAPRGDRKGGNAIVAAWRGKTCAGVDQPIRAARRRRSEPSK